jgi:hypothetical protein
MVAHYADTPETDARMEKTVELFRKNNLPIFVFASPTFNSHEKLELTLRDELCRRGIPLEMIRCSGEFGDLACFDTVQEMENILTTVEALGIKDLYCVSNKLQLLQILALSHNFSVKLHPIVSPLKEWRWWYVSTRLALIPLAQLGVGRDFALLKLVRYGREKWAFFRI